MQTDESPRIDQSDHAAHAGNVAGATLHSDADVHAHGLYRLGFNYGRLIYRMRWVVIALWVVGLAVSIPFAARVTSVLTGGGYSFSGSESAQASDIIASKLRVPPEGILVAFHSTTASVSDASYQDQLNAVRSRILTYPQVVSATPSQPGKDGRTIYLTVTFDKSVSDVEAQVPDFKRALADQPVSGPATLYVTGRPAIYSDFTELTRDDTQQAEAAALPIALVVLLIVFGTLVAALTPLALALMAVPVALAIIYGIATQTETSVFVLNIASIIGLGISIDYSLFMTRRFREELAAGRGTRDAVAWTVSTAGEAILFSGLTVMIGFSGLLLIGIPFMTSLGLGGICTVGASVLAALTLLPALLGVLGPRINALRIPLLGRFFTGRSASGERRGFWHTLALVVMRRPVVVMLGVAALLVLLGWPIFSINIGTPSSSGLPRSSEARQGIDLINAQFPETSENPVLVVVQTNDGSSMLSEVNLGRLSELTQWLKGRPHVTGVTSLVALPQTPGTQPVPASQLIQLYSTGAYQRDPGLTQLLTSTTNGDTTLITVRTDSPVDSAEGKALIDDIRAHDSQVSPGVHALVGGFQAVSLDFNRYLYGNFPKAIAFILGATFILLLIMFRSLVLPLKAILMNVLSVSASYGVLVFVFQQGNFQDLLGFESNGFIDSTIPILMFCILFGLSMDYEVFLLSRIREEWLRSRNNRYAVARGLEMTGGVITNAALLFMIVAGAFIFTRLVMTKEIGLGMTVAVLVDAAIIRTLLVPATMRLVGRWNWWLPGRPLPVERQG